VVDSTTRSSWPAAGWYCQTWPRCASPPLVELKKMLPSPYEHPSSRRKRAAPCAKPWSKTADGVRLGIRRIGIGDVDPGDRQRLADVLVLRGVVVRAACDGE